MRRWIPAAAVVVFGVALLARAAWVLVRWAQGGAAFEFSDEEIHWQLASNLVAGGGLSTDDGRLAVRMPLYPLFLALFAWLGQTGILVARLAQCVVGAATAGLAFLLADAALGRRAAIAAGLLVCFDPYAIFFANLLLTETVFAFLAVALTACAWAVAVRTPSRATVGVGLLGAAAVLTRPSAAGWIPLLWLMLWAFDSDRGRAVRRVALYAGILIVCLLPWGVRNRVVLGSFAWLSANGGVTLYDAQGPQAGGDSDQSFLKDMPEIDGLDEVARDQALQRLAIEQMRDDPLRVLRLAGVKFLRTWSLTPNVESYRGGVTGIVSATFTLGVLVAAGVGLLRRRGAKSLVVLLWLPVVYFTLLHCIYVGSLRYRIPLMPFVEIAAACAFVSRGAGQTPTEGVARAASQRGR